MKTTTPRPLPDALRRKLIFALPGGLALASPLALVGCGGGDAASTDAAAPAGPPLPAMERTVVTLKLELPAGTVVSLRDCNLITGNNASEVASDGSAGAVLLRDAPQMGFLMAADGRLLLMGAIEAGRTALNSRTTAEALIFLASEVAMLQPALQIALRNVLQTHAIVEPVRLAVEAALQRNGISDQDGELMTALAAAVSVIRRRAPAAGGASAGRARALKVTVTPADIVSGVRVTRDAAFNTVSFENRFRRRAHAWVERVAYFDSNGLERSLPAPQPLGSPNGFDLSATTALSFDNLVKAVGDFILELAVDIGVVGDYQSGTLPFEPVASAPLYLPIQPDDAQSSIYRTRVVGVGATQADAFTAAEQNIYDKLLVATVWEDIVLPIMQTVVLPLISARLGPAFQNEVKVLWLAAIGADAVNSAFLSGLFPNTIDKVKQGDASGAIWAFWIEFFSSNTWAELVKTAISRMLGHGPGALTFRDGSNNIFQVNLLGSDLPSKAAQFQDGLGKAMKIIAVTKALATVADFAAMAKDWASSQQRSEFKLASSGTTLAFTPEAVSAIPGLSVPLTAKLGETSEIGSGSVIRYEWSVSGGAGGRLRNPTNQATGATISTSTATVDYLAAESATAGATDQVTVKAFLTDIGTSGGGVIAVVKAPAVVTIGSVRLSPSSVDFKKIDGTERQEFTVMFSMGFGGGAGLVYEWNCASAYGYISDNAQLSSSGAPTFRSAKPQVTYTAGAQASNGDTETVKVRVLRITSAPGAATETTDTVATLESVVRFGQFTVELVSLPAEVPSDNNFAVVARITDPVPAGATIEWSWLHSGVGSITTSLADANKPNSSVQFSSGASEGLAIFTVSARVTVPGQPAIPVLPVTASTNVKKGLRKLTLPGYWVLEPGVIPQDPVCGIDGAGKQVCVLGHLDTWITYVVPKVPNAASGLFTVYRPDGIVLAQIPMTHPNLVDGGNVWRWRYWALNSVYGSYDGVPDLEKVQADAIAYLLFRVRTDGPTTAGVYTLKP